MALLLLLLCLGGAEGFMAPGLQPRAAPRATTALATGVDAAYFTDAADAAFFTAALVGAAYFSGYATEGYEPHKL